MLVFAGAIIIMLSLIREIRVREEESKVETGGVVIIGPIPIVFGTSARIAKIMLVLSIALVILLIILHLLLWSSIRWWK